MTEAIQHSVIFLEPPELAFGAVPGNNPISRFLNWAGLKILLWVIVKLEGPRLPPNVGPYTHCAISDNVNFMDATLSDDFPTPEPLAELGTRPYDCYEHQTDGLLETVYLQAEALAGEEPPMWYRFSIKSLLWLIGIGLLAESRFDFVASVIVGRLSNEPGLYCSEFVSEIIWQFGGEPLYVTVDEDRVPGYMENVSQETFFSRVETRNAFWAGSGGTINVDPGGAWKAFLKLADAVATQGLDPVLVPVGYTSPDDDPMIPPFLVGLSDLVNSPQLSQVPCYSELE